MSGRRGSGEPAIADVLRVMTWNVWWRFGEDWRRRERGIVSTLSDLAPDIVGLQEAWVGPDDSQARQLGEALGMHFADAVPSLPPPPPRPESEDDVGVEVGVAVLSRWPIVERRVHALPSGHRDEIVALAVTIDHPLGPVRVTSSCSDWDATFGPQRVSQSRALRATLVEQTRADVRAAFITADLNAPPDTAEVQVLAEVAVDAWAAGAPAEDDGNTLSSTNPLAPRAAAQIDQRIDYILVRAGDSHRPVTVERAFLAGQPVNGVHPSDHYAVVADVRL